MRAVFWCLKDDVSKSGVHSSNGKIESHRQANITNSKFPTTKKRTADYELLEESLEVA